jgi:hypothetical protein
VEPTGVSHHAGHGPSSLPELTVLQPPIASDRK